MPPKKSKRVSKRERLIKRLMAAGYTKAQAEKIIRAGVKKLLGNKKPSRPKRPTKPTGVTFAPANPSATRPHLQSPDATHMMQQQAQESALESRVTQMREITRLAQENKAIAEEDLKEEKKRASQFQLQAEAAKMSADREATEAERLRINAGQFQAQAAEEKKRATEEKERARLEAERAAELKELHEDELKRVDRARRRLQDFQTLSTALSGPMDLSGASRPKLIKLLFEKFKEYPKLRRQLVADDSDDDISAKDQV